MPCTIEIISRTPGNIHLRFLDGEISSKDRPTDFLLLDPPARERTFLIDGWADLIHDHNRVTLDLGQVLEIDLVGDRLLMDIARMSSKLRQPETDGVVLLDNLQDPVSHHLRKVGIWSLLHFVSD